MRSSTLFAATVATTLLAASAARACEPAAAACPLAVVVFPAYTPEGHRLGTVEAPVRRQPPLELSRFTGQPLTVVFNNPGALPGLVEPYLDLVPLPSVPHFKTRAVYPRGY